MLEGDKDIKEITLENHTEHNKELLLQEIDEGITSKCHAKMLYPQKDDGDIVVSESESEEL